MVTPSFSETLELFTGTWGAGRATAGSHTISSVAFPTLPGQSAPVQFTAADVGCPIAIVGAGAVDPFMPVIYNVQGATLRSVITAVNSPTSVTIADAAITSYYNSGFRNVAVFRPTGMLLDSQQYASSVAQGTRDTLSYTVLRTEPYFTRNQVLLEGQPIYLRSTDAAQGDIFGGLIDSIVVTNQPQPGGGGGLAGATCAAGTVPFAYLCNCASWDSIPGRRRVHAEDAMILTGPVDEVVRKLQCICLIDEGCAVTGVTGGPIITLPVPAGAVLSDLLDQACQLATTVDDIWFWKFDPWRNLTLAKRTTTAAPWNVNDTDGTDDNILVAVSATGTHDQLANTVFGLGSQVLVGTIHTVFNGDGATRNFDVAANIGAEPLITLDTGSGSASQTVGIYQVETGKNWYWNQGSKTIVQDPAGTVMQAADILLVTWKPLVPALAVAYNNAGLQERAIVEGPGYAYESAISVTQPTTPDQLLQNAQQVATQTGAVPKTINITTLRAGLKTGMLQHITLADAAVDDDFLIVAVKMGSSGGLLYWDYEARNGHGAPGWGAALTQFINRNSPTLGLVTPSQPITAVANRITIDHTKVSGGADITNFAFCFVGTYPFLATQANGGSVAHADGADIFFSSDAAGSALLDFDFDYWDGATGACVFWVRIPTLSHTADTVIYIQAGDASVSVSRANSGAVWSPYPTVLGVPDGNFHGVFHLGDLVAPYKDASKFANNSVSGSSAGQAMGKLDHAQIFAASGITLTNNLLAGNGFSNIQAGISCWMKRVGPPSTDEGLAQNLSGIAAVGIAIGVKASTGFAWGGSSDSGQMVSAVNVCDGNWHHVALTTIGSGSAVLYVDGVAVASGAHLSTFFGGTYPSALASASAIGTTWAALTGYVDESHWTQTALSAGWIATEYANQNDPSAFYFVGLPPGLIVTQAGNPTGTVTHATGALSADAPIFGNGGADIKPGTKTGDTNQAQMADGAAGAAGAPLIYDASGNAVAGAVGRFVPAGGTTGQTLTKQSGTNYDTAWADQATADVLIDGASTMCAVFVNGALMAVVPTVFYFEGVYTA